MSIPYFPPEILIEQICREDPVYMRFQIASTVDLLYLVQGAHFENVALGFICEPEIST